MTGSTFWEWKQYSFLESLYDELQYLEDTRDYSDFGSFWEDMADFDRYLIQQQDEELYDLMEAHVEGLEEWNEAYETLDDEQRRVRTTFDDYALVSGYGSPTVKVDTDREIDFTAFVLDYPDLVCAPEDADDFQRRLQEEDSLYSEAFQDEYPDWHETMWAVLTEEDPSFKTVMTNLMMAEVTVQETVDELYERLDHWIDQSILSRGDG